MNSDKGFTLLEVLISIVILAFISLSIYQATVTTYRIRDSLASEGDFYNAIRLGMSIFENDLTQTYSPLLMALQDPINDNRSVSQLKPDDINQLRGLLGGDVERVTDYWGAMYQKNGLRLSRFKGSSDSVSLISASHNRIYREVSESVFVKVKYEIEDDPSIPKDSKELANTKMLVRTIDTNAFEIERDTPSTQKRYPLIHGIKKWKISYFQRLRKGYEPRWDTESQENRGKFPDHILVEAEFVGQDRMVFEGRYQFRMELPLNGLPASF